jgi:hypothetical protein
MGRGENNILFGKHLLVKRDKKKKGAQGFFPSPVEELIVTQDFVLFRDRYSLRLLNEDMVADTTETRPMPSNAAMTASGKMFAWGDDKGFFIHNLSSDAVRNIPREALPGQPLGLHIAGDFLYCLWQDEKGFKISRTTTHNPDDVWQDMFSYQSDDLPSLTHKGNTSLSLFFDDKKKEYSIVSILKNGPSDALEIHNAKVRGDNPERLIAPTERGGAFFALAHTWHNNPEMMVLFKVGRPVLDGSLGRADEKTLFSLDNLEGKKYLEVDSSGKKGVLLTDKELVVFTEDDGIVETFPLEEDKYQRVSFTGNKAVLWSPGEQAFLQFDLS